MSVTQLQCKTCPVCGTRLRRITQPITTWQKLGMKHSVKFDRHLVACFECRVVVRLNRMPKKYTERGPA